MLRKVLLGVFVSLILFCSFSPQTAAQSSSARKQLTGQRLTELFPARDGFGIRNIPALTPG